MFIQVKKKGYNKDDEQFCSGKFLIFMLPEEEGFMKSDKPIKCLIRQCEMKPLGNWMMGRVRVGGQTLSVSGCYGSDGLAMTVPPYIYNMGVELPKELYEMWNTGGGWNSCGSEGEAVLEWAKKTFLK